MTIATYTELKTAYSDHLARSTLTSYYDTLTILAETRIFNGSKDKEFPTPPLRIRMMETFSDPTTFLTVANTSTLALPTGYLGQTKDRECYISGTPNTELRFTTRRELLTLFASDVTDLPQCYTIHGENLLFGPIPDAAYGVVLGYYKRPDSLTVTPTNTLLTNSPNVYLYAGLLELALFGRNFERAEIYGRLYAAALNGIVDADDLDRWPGQLVSNVEIDPP